MRRLVSGNKYITEIMHNELNIFLLTNISAKQLRNNTKWFNRQESGLQSSKAIIC